MDIEIDKLGWICIKNRRLLVARSKGKAIYYIPGGKREDGESDHDALIREIKEELSVDLKPGTIKYAETFKAPAHDKSETIVKITCYIAEFNGEITPSGEIEEVIWVNFEDKRKCSAVTNIIIDWLKSEGLIEFKSFS